MKKATGKLIKGRHGEMAIGIKRNDEPTQAWRDIQKKKAIRNATGQWWQVFPLTGGAGCWPESYFTVVGDPSKEITDKAMEFTSPTARTVIRLMFPAYYDAPILDDLERTILEATHPELV